MNFLNWLSGKFGDIWIKWSWPFSTTFSRKVKDVREPNREDSGQILSK